MKKLILTLLLLSTSLMASQITPWFNKKFESFKPHLLKVSEMTSYGVTTVYLTIKNKYEKVYETQFVLNDGGVGENYIFDKCVPDMNIEENKYVLSYNSFCVDRFNLSGYKKFLTNYMHTISNTVSNAVYGTYKEPTQKEFVITPEVK